MILCLFVRVYYYVLLLHLSPHCQQGVIYTPIGGLLGVVHPPIDVNTHHKHLLPIGYVCTVLVVYSYRA